MKLASGIRPSSAARKAGVDVGLGTDGVAGSNNDHDMWEAMDFAGQAGEGLDDGPDGPAREDPPAHGDDRGRPGA